MCGAPTVIGHLLLRRRAASRAAPSAAIATPATPSPAGAPGATAQQLPAPDASPLLPLVQAAAPVCAVEHAVEKPWRGVASQSEGMVEPGGYTAQMPAISSSPGLRRLMSPGM